MNKTAANALLTRLLSAVKRIGAAKLVRARLSPDLYAELAGGLKAQPNEPLRIWGVPVSLDHEVADFELDFNERAELAHLDTEELIGELFRRHDACIVSVSRDLNDREEERVLHYHGGLVRCVGLANLLTARLADVALGDGDHE